MRYTTILDLRDWPRLYRNPNVRLTYLHLVLVAGYHDDNRDKATCSLRSMSADTGLTLSAIRNALHALENARIIKRTSTGIMVAKILKERTITKRQLQSVGTIQDTPTADRPRLSSLDQLKARAAAGDESAAKIIAKHFKT